MTRIAAYIVTLFFAVTVLFIFLSVIGNAAPPILVDRQTGKYLGTLSANPYDQDSVSNIYGRYGSPYSQDSINNHVGEYGSPYSNNSINNPYATNPPIILDSDKDNY
jgi:hypothetical protein